MYSSVKSFFKKSKFLVKIVQAYKYPIIRKRLMKNGLKTITEMGEVLEEAGYNYFVDFGTLLGIVREGQLISHDLDIDIGILLEQEKKMENLRELLETNGFIRTEYFTYLDKIVEESYVKNKVKIDIFYYELEDDQMYCYFSFRDDSTVYQNDFEHTASKLYFSRVTEIEHLSTETFIVAIPKNSEKVLEEKYGKNWRVPDKNYSHEDDKNLVLLSQKSMHHIEG